MRRFLGFQLFLFSAVLLLWAHACAAAPAITFNGAPLRTDLPVDTRQGELFMPLTQGVAYSLGATLDAYLEQDRIRAVVQWLGYQIEFVEGDTRMLVDGEPATLPTAPYADDAGVLMVPAADFFLAVRADVSYDRTAMTMHVTRRVEAPDVVGELPPEVLGPPGEEDAAGDTDGGGMTDAELDEFFGGEGALLFTAENSFGVEVDSVSGDRSQSYLTPRQIVTNRFTLRMQGQVPEGFALTGFIRANGTTDRDRKRGELQKMNFLFEKQDMAISLYDILPRFSRYTLRNYRLQGVDVLRTEGSFSFHAVAGKSPRKYKDSRYQRMAAAARARWGSDNEHVALNYVAIRDLGSPQGTEKLDNRVGTLSARALAPGGWTLFGELAAADTDFLLSGGQASSTALQMQARRKTKNTSLELSYENTGADFISESAYFTRGKHEWSALWNARPHPRMSVGLGHRNRLLKGSHTYIYPVLLSLIPVGSRTTLKVDLRRNYERTTGASHSTVDHRRVDVRDQIGRVNAQASLARRKTRNISVEVALRTTYDFKARFLLTPRILVLAQHNKEKRQNASTPITRFYRTRFTIELGDWTDMNITLERYYNASRNNRNGAILGFRHLDVITDTEYILDYSFMNYRDHNDHSFKMRYNIYQ